MAASVWWHELRECARRRCRPGSMNWDAGAPSGRVRHAGGGRKRAVDLDPGLRPALLALVEPEECGDPMSPLRWTTKSTRKLANELTRQGHRVGRPSPGFGSAAGHRS